MRHLPNPALSAGEPLFSILETALPGRLAGRVRPSRPWRRERSRVGVSVASSSFCASWISSLSLHEVKAALVERAERGELGG